MKTINLSETAMKEALTIREILNTSPFRETIEEDIPFYTRTKRNIVMEDLLKLPLKRVNYQTMEMNFPFIVSLPDWETIFREEWNRTHSQEELNSWDNLLFSHMMQLQELRPLSVIRMALEKKLLTYMIEKEKMISEERDLLNQKLLNLKKDQSLSFQELTTQLQTLGVQNNQQLMEDQVYLTESKTVDTEERTLQIIQQMYLIENKEDYYSQEMEFLENTIIPLPDNLMEILNSQDLSLYSQQMQEALSPALHYPPQKLTKQELRQKISLSDQQIQQILLLTGYLQKNLTIEKTKLLRQFTQTASAPLAETCWLVEQLITLRVGMFTLQKLMDEGTLL